ncbi:hypothetical protein CL644_01905 [bacterium]|nr:hypothetical protein [bacterium]
MVGEELCFSHNPKAENAKREAVKKGGEARKRERGLLEPVDIKSRKDVIALLEDVINRMRKEKMTYQEANSIKSLSKILVDLLKEQKFHDDANGWRA